MKLNNEVIELKKEIWETWDSLYYVQKDLANFQQYSRRENIEICGIPECYDANLEFTLVRILKKIGLPHISSYDIIACHCLKKLMKDKPANVILRFVNRKDAYVSLVNRKHLKTHIPEMPNLFIIENLCLKYRAIFDACLNLKKDGKIKHVWSFNGIVHFKKSDNYRERGIKVFHISELEDYFPKMK